MSIVKSSIKEQVYNMLKEKILKQDIELGVQLNPKRIAEENDISVMPVRDALLRLVSQGLVINKPRVGFFVKEFSQAEIEEIMEVRKMYELFCIKEHFTGIDRKKMKNISKTVNINIEDLTREKFDGVDIELHYTIIEASENEFLINNYNQIKDLLILFQHLDLQRINESHKEHQIIVKYILGKDKSKAQEMLENHLNRVTLSVLDTVEEEDVDTKNIWV